MSEITTTNLSNPESRRAAPVPPVVGSRPIGQQVNLYLLTAVLYLTVAVLAAVDSAVTSFSLIPWFSGLRWLRVHLITLGAITQALFGVLPGIVTGRSGVVGAGLSTWLVLNSGIVVLIAGIPAMNTELIFVGGTLVFGAVVALVRRLHASCDRTGPDARFGGTRFYVAGFVYFLVGIIVGTGLWLGWSEALAIRIPIEVHIHANNWGLMSLVFAGLIVDNYRHWTGRDLAWPRSVPIIFWTMTIGALGLVLGPWLGSNWFAVPGLVLHLAATGWLLASVIVPLRGDRAVWRRPGIWHLTTSYTWILAPVLIAPLIILGVAGFPGAGVEQNAPQALIYGWVLQFGYALVPYLFRRLFRRGEQPELGGSWLSLAAVHLGGVLLWVGIFATEAQGILHGFAYTLWAISIIPILTDLVRTTRTGIEATSGAVEPA